MADCDSNIHKGMMIETSPGHWEDSDGEVFVDKYTILENGECVTKYRVSERVIENTFNTLDEYVSPDKALMRAKKKAIIKVRLIHKDPDTG